MLRVISENSVRPSAVLKTKHLPDLANMNALPNHLIGIFYLGTRCITRLQPIYVPNRNWYDIWGDFSILISCTPASRRRISTYCHTSFEFRNFFIQCTNTHLLRSQVPYALCSITARFHTTLNGKQMPGCVKYSHSSDQFAIAIAINKYLISFFILHPRPFPFSARRRISFLFLFVRCSERWLSIEQKTMATEEKISPLILSLCGMQSPSTCKLHMLLWVWRFWDCCWRDARAHTRRLALYLLARQNGCKHLQEMIRKLCGFSWGGTQDAEQTQITQRLLFYSFYLTPLYLSWRIQVGGRRVNCCILAKSEKMKPLQCREFSSLLLCCA